MIATEPASTGGEILSTIAGFTFPSGTRHPVNKRQATMRSEPADVRAYFEALGRLVTQFAEVEAFLARTLWNTIGAPNPIGHALFAGIRSSDAVKHINRIHSVTNASENTRGRVQTSFRATPDHHRRSEPHHPLWHPIF